MRDLITQIRNGNQEAFEKFFWLHNEHVYNFIFSFLHDRFLAEDLTQNVFLKIWEKRKDIDVDKSIDAYVFTIARHFVYKEVEMQLKKQVLDDVLVENLVDPEESADEKINLKQLHEHFKEIVEELPSIRREIFQLSRNEHLSYKEIAFRLSISEKTVENQINRALKYIRMRLTYLFAFILFFA